MLGRLWDRVAGNIDGPLMMIASMLLAMGLATLYSAAGDAPARFFAQLVNIGIALAAMWVIAQIPPQTLMRFAVPIYCIGIILLIGEIGRASCRERVCLAV